MMEKKTILEMTGISKSFYGVKVLKDVQFNAYEGEIIALIGENGAGKSTLMKILAGIYSKDTGTVRLYGQETTINDPLEARMQHIAFIHQEISLCPNLTIAENVFLGSELIDRLGFVNNTEALYRTQAMLDQMNLNLRADMLVAKLTIAQQQMVEIVKALMYQAKIIIMDEPTAALSDNETASLFSKTRELAQQGITTIFISHRLKEIFTICDRVTVMRDGTYVDTRYIRDITEDDLVRMMIGREMTEMYAGEHSRGGDTILEVRNFKNKHLKDVSFELKRGEVLGFAGLVGAGRTELASAIFGLDKLDSGELLLNGRETEIHTPADAIRNGIGLVPEDRKKCGLVLQQTVAYNLTMAVLDKFIKGIHCNYKKEAQIVEEYAGKLSIKMTGIDQICNYLSGGNQQKVVISKWLATGADILIFDEPTRGIDVGAKSEIYHLITDLAKSGKAIIVISSDLPEVMNISSRIAIMWEGRLMKVLDNMERPLTEECIMHYATGGE